MTAKRINTIKLFPGFCLIGPLLRMRINAVTKASIIKLVPSLNKAIKRTLN